MTTLITSDWKNKALAATEGSQFGAILRCALHENIPGRNPHFTGKAMVTSDGFVMCDFVDKNGDLHIGAFVGAKTDLDRNVVGLSKHLKLNATEAGELSAVVAKWIGKYWRS